MNDESLLLLETATAEPISSLTHSSSQDHHPTAPSQMSSAAENGAHRDAGDVSVENQAESQGQRLRWIIERLEQEGRTRRVSLHGLHTITPGDSYRLLNALRESSSHSIQGINQETWPLETGSVLLDGASVDNGESGSDVPSTPETFVTASRLMALRNGARETSLSASAGEYVSEPRAGEIHPTTIPRGIAATHERINLQATPGWRGADADQSVPGPHIDMIVPAPVTDLLDEDLASNLVGNAREMEHNETRRQMIQEAMRLLQAIESDPTGRQWPAIRRYLARYERRMAAAAPRRDSQQASSDQISDLDLNARRMRRQAMVSLVDGSLVRLRRGNFSSAAAVQGWVTSAAEGSCPWDLLMRRGDRNSETGSPTPSSYFPHPDVDTDGIPATNDDEPVHHSEVSTSLHGADASSPSVESHHDTQSSHNRPLQAPSSPSTSFINVFMARRQAQSTSGRAQGLSLSSTLGEARLVEMRMPGRGALGAVDSHRRDGSSSPNSASSRISRPNGRRNSSTTGLLAPNVTSGSSQPSITINGHSPQLGGRRIAGRNNPAALGGVRMARGNGRDQRSHDDNAQYTRSVTSDDTLTVNGGRPRRILESDSSDSNNSEGPVSPLLPGSVLENGPISRSRLPRSSRGSRNGRGEGRRGFATSTGTEWSHLDANGDFLPPRSATSRATNLRDLLTGTTDNPLEIIPRLMTAIQRGLGSLGDAGVEEGRSEDTSQRVLQEVEQQDSGTQLSAMAARLRTVMDTLINLPTIDTDIGIENLSSRIAVMSANLSGAINSLQDGDPPPLEAVTGTVQSSSASTSQTSSLPGSFAGDGRIDRRRRLSDASTAEYQTRRQRRDPASSSVRSSLRASFQVLNTASLGADGEDGTTHVAPSVSDPVDPVLRSPDFTDSTLRNGDHGWGRLDTHNPSRSQSVVDSSQPGSVRNQQLFLLNQLQHMLGTTPTTLSTRTPYSRRTRARNTSTTPQAPLRQPPTTRPHPTDLTPHHSTAKPDPRSPEITTACSLAKLLDQNGDPVDRSAGCDADSIMRVLCYHYERCFVDGGPGGSGGGNATSGSGGTWGANGGNGGSDASGGGWGRPPITTGLTPVVEVTGGGLRWLGRRGRSSTFVDR
ncbi:hypothetical protein HDU67_009516 [Dinochytrium kinnereticum]|nr:hypothetical protein HDU67_009516 [Dinochytrium kinnereticum]